MCNQLPSMDLCNVNCTISIEIINSTSRSRMVRDRVGTAFIVMLVSSMPPDSIPGGGISFNFSALHEKCCVIIGRRKLGLRGAGKEFFTPPLWRRSSWRACADRKGGLFFRDRSYMRKKGTSSNMFRSGSYVSSAGLSTLQHMWTTQTYVDFKTFSECTSLRRLCTSMPVYDERTWDRIEFSYRDESL